MTSFEISIIVDDVKNEEEAKQWLKNNCDFDILSLISDIEEIEND